MATPDPPYLLLEEAKRRLSERLGVSRVSLHRMGYVHQLRSRGLYLGRVPTPDGGIKLSCFRVPASAVDEVAAMAALGGPMPK